jgi:hypothetical protein
MRVLNILTNYKLQLFESAKIEHPKYLIFEKIHKVMTKMAL